MGSLTSRLTFGLTNGRIVTANTAFPGGGLTQSLTQLLPGTAISTVDFKLWGAGGGGGGTLGGDGGGGGGGGFVAGSIPWVPGTTYKDRKSVV